MYDASYQALENASSPVLDSAAGHIKLVRYTSTCLSVTVSYK